MVEQAACVRLGSKQREESLTVPSKSCHQWPKASLLAFLLRNPTASETALQAETKALESHKTQTVT